MKLIEFFFSFLFHSRDRVFKLNLKNVSLAGCEVSTTFKLSIHNDCNQFVNENEHIRTKRRKTKLHF